jgi:hypothetical protein
MIYVHYSKKKKMITIKKISFYLLKLYNGHQSFPWVYDVYKYNGISIETWYSERWLAQCQTFTSCLTI